MLAQCIGTLSVKRGVGYVSILRRIKCLLLALVGKKCKPKRVKVELGKLRV